MPKNDSKIDYVIVNGAECEPYITSDYRLMMEERPESVVEGLKIVLRLFENAKGVLPLRIINPMLLRNLRSLPPVSHGLSVLSLKTKYPQGGEGQLIYAVTGRKLNSKTSCRRWMYM